MSEAAIQRQQMQRTLDRIRAGTALVAQMERRVRSAQADGREAHLEAQALLHAEQAVQVFQRLYRSERARARRSLAHSGSKTR